MKIDYGEILFVGPCNFKCFYCLGHEMAESAKEVRMLNTHFYEWNNFNEWLTFLKDHNAPKIYLSSTNSEPLMYKYLDELIDFLQDTHGFKVGIRTNASLGTELCNKLNGSVSLSLQSLNPETFKKITGVDLNFDFMQNLDSIKNKSVRVTIVVNRYNYKEVFDMIHQLKGHNVKYIQLRQCYKYYDTDITEDVNVFNYVINKLEGYKHIGNFNESEIYDVDGQEVSVWRTVFKKSSIRSSNFFTNGLITGNNLLVEGYNDYQRVLHGQIR